METGIEYLRLGDDEATSIVRESKGTASAANTRSAVTVQ